jgi:hypothetical protein
VDAVDRMIGDALQDVAQIEFWIDTVNPDFSPWVTSRLI